MVGKAPQSHGPRSGLYGGCSNGLHRSTFSKLNTEFSSDLAACDFCSFSTMKKEIQCKKFRSDQRSAARFREMGGAL
jgi:hypothetical protein